MAMIYCRECGARHSDRAKKCPKCGYMEFNAEKSMIIYFVLLLFFGVFGAHKFYAKKIGQGIAMLLMGTLGCLLIVPAVVVGIWFVADLIIFAINIEHPEKIFVNKK